ncbi:carbohydrate ABC transporter permease [Thermoanaerobacterium saccharolyticum]|uniref:Multiple sugar transport system permease protein n=1 Tax=Thermoanaerobacterium butyriciformans TaxID=1702242 RepID=A0ABS4NDL0_9THEO|nr:carbohydrate ABC transporter permease [Thermoanaerobacterium butyriciformans]MBP2071762.1 multiple sugar transport system permease protein [Thermoanaerobacterium butyriciformans]
MPISIIKAYVKKFDKITIDSNTLSKYYGKLKGWLFTLFKFAILLGLSYIILGPLINIFSNSFFSSEDVYNPAVFMIPIKPTLNNYHLALLRLDYFSTLGHTLIYIITITLIQILITSMVGYGFARFDFPLKNLLFGCVIITIVLPTHTIMLPLYQHFRNWDLLGVFRLLGMKPINLLSSETPMYLMTIFGTGLRSGLFIYIFRQFFRGLPKELEEAAFIDGAGPWYTFFRIMLVNAMPAVITVAVFSMVWQYNDTFYSQLFTMPTDHILTLRLSTIQATLEFIDEIKDPMVSQLAVYAGTILIILPILVIYLLMQKYLVEGIERSGIVG